MRHLSRRNFLFLSAAAAAARASSLSSSDATWPDPRARVSELERPRVMQAAQRFLSEKPQTIVSARAQRSAGGPHDYYSEADYWWPDPKNPNGPYIQRDGQSNPANFVAHRDRMRRLSIQVPALASAWVLTKQRKFADHAAAHLRAWFVEPATRMNPNLEFAQAIHGIDTGRSIGIIDTLHLVEVAQAVIVLDETGGIAAPDYGGIRSWFADYLTWLTTSPHGRQERDAKNNHGTCWLLQAAEFATLTGNSGVRNDCRERLKSVIFPGQIAADGSFPLELARTKPYSYSLFNLDILAMNAHVLSDSAKDLWTFKLADGRGLEACFRFMTPFIDSKASWPYKPDVEYFDDLPVRQPSLLFAGLAYRKREYLDLWQNLNPDPTVPEVVRNHPIRQPLLWMRA